MAVQARQFNVSLERRKLEEARDQKAREIGVAEQKANVQRQRAATRIARLYRRVRGVRREVAAVRIQRAARSRQRWSTIVRNAQRRFFARGSACGAFCAASVARRLNRHLESRQQRDTIWNGSMLARERGWFGRMRQRAGSRTLSGTT